MKESYPEKSAEVERLLKQLKMPWEEDKERWEAFPQSRRLEFLRLLNSTEPYNEPEAFRIMLEAQTPMSVPIPEMFCGCIQDGKKARTN